jgi:hypothetical protein
MKHAVRAHRAGACTPRLESTNTILAHNNNQADYEREHRASYRGAALHKCAFKINASQQPWAHHDPNALPFARGKRRGDCGGERTRKEIEMHLLPKAITSTRQPHLSRCAQMQFSRFAEGPQTCSISSDRLIACHGAAHTHKCSFLSLPHPLFFLRAACTRRVGQCMYVPLVDCNRGLMLGACAAAAPVLGAILLSSVCEMPIPIGAIQSSMIELLEAP